MDKWDENKYKNMVLLQSQTYLYRAEMYLLLMKKLNSSELQSEYNNNILNCFIKSCQLSSSINENWLVENAAILFWNSYIAILTDEQSNDKVDEILITTLTTLINQLEVIKSQDMQLMVQLYWGIINIRAKQVCGLLILESME